MPYRARTSEPLLDALAGMFEGRSRKDLRRPDRRDQGVNDFCKHECAFHIAKETARPRSLSE